MRKKISKVWGKIRKTDRNLRKKWGKWNSCPPGPERLTTAQKRSPSPLCPWPCFLCVWSRLTLTGRSLATRHKEHRTEVEKITEKIHTRATRLSSISYQHKSAIADHVTSCTKHITDCEDPKILHRESDKFTRWIRESNSIRSRGNKAMDNRGGGGAPPLTTSIMYTTMSSRILETPHLDVPITIRDQEASQFGLETS